MTTTYDLDKKIAKVKAARKRANLRYGKPQKTALTQRQTDLNSLKVLHDALENGDLSTGGRRVMMRSFRRIMRRCEGKSTLGSRESKVIR